MFKAIKRIKKMGIIGFLIIIQLSVGLTMINTSGRLLEDSQNRKEGIENLFDIANTTMVKIDIIEDIGTDAKKYWKYLKKALETKDIYENMKKNKFIKDYYIYGEDGNKYDVFEENLPEKYKNLSDIHRGIHLGEIIINENFFNHYDIKISSGRTFTSEDFNKSYKEGNIPILMGKDFEGIYKLGQEFKVKYFSDAITDENNKITLKEDFITFEIVGFLENNAIPIPNGPTELFATTLLYSNGIKVIPSVKDYLGYNALPMTIDTALFIERSSDVTESELVKELNNKLEKHGLKANLFTLSNTTTVIESYERDVESSLALGGLLLIISMIGTSCIMLGQLNKRKKEFGIKIAMGATLNEIAKDIFLEILAMATIATIISLILNIKNGIGFSIIGINIVLVTVISLIIAIFPIREIKKMKVIELVKEK